MVVIFFMNTIAKSYVKRLSETLITFVVLTQKVFCLIKAFGTQNFKRFENNFAASFKSRLISVLKSFFAVLSKNIFEALQQEVLN